jgi:chromosome segregation ATPase
MRDPIYKEEMYKALARVSDLEAEVARLCEELELQRDMVAESLRAQSTTEDALDAERVAHEATIADLEGVITCLNSDIAGVLADRRSLESTLKATKGEITKWKAAAETRVAEHEAAQAQIRELLDANGAMLSGHMRERAELMAELERMTTDRDVLSNEGKAWADRYVARGHKLLRAEFDVAQALSDLDQKQVALNVETQAKLAAERQVAALQAKVARAMAALGRYPVEGYADPIREALEALR